jgi:N-acetylglutamate synthase
MTQLRPPLMVADEAYVNSFPAPAQVLLDGWLLRFAGGYTRRANSIAPLTDKIGDDVQAKIAACATLYAAQGLPPLYRIPSFHDAALDTTLAELGYAREGDTLVLQASIEAAAPVDAVELTEGFPTEEWLDAQALFSGGSETIRAARRRILGALGVPCVFAASRIDGPGSPIASLAMGAVHAGHLCLHMVVTDPAARRRGLSRQTVAAVMAWGRDKAGATTACLGVAAGNEAAITLYRGVGFRTDLYRYHYRRMS